MADHMIIRYREKAEKWAQQAEKAQRRVYMDTITRFKFQDASYYLELAAQCFRVAKRFQDAGVAYKQCGRMEERLKKPDVAASFYHEAALCCQKDDPQEAAACYLSSINLYCQIQRFSTAARLEIEVAELMKKDRNRPLAIVHYIKAADFYKANTCCDKAADRCLLKAAQALGLCERYQEAAALFQEVGRRMVVDDLLKYNSPDVFLSAVLCLQCASGIPETSPGSRQKAGSEQPPPRPTNSSVKATIVLLGKASSVFQSSRAFLFAMDVAKAGARGDLDLLAERVYAYDNVCRLDAWHLRILKTIADHVEAKSATIRKMRATQEKLRRKQLAAERARDLIKSRQPDSIQQDLSEGTLSASSEPSSDATLPATTGANARETRKSSSSSLSSSESGSASESESSSSGTASDSPSSSSSAETRSTSPSSGSQSETDGNNKGNGSARSESTRKRNVSASTAPKKKEKAGSTGGSGSESELSSLRSDSNSEHSERVAGPKKKDREARKPAKGKLSPSGSESDTSQERSQLVESRTGSAGGSISELSDDEGLKMKSAGSKTKKRENGKIPEVLVADKKVKSVFWRRR